MAPNRRCHYSAAFKRKVVLAAESSSNVQAGRDFGVDEKNVRRWRGQREKLFACAATRMAFTGPRKGRHPEMETALADFVRTQRAAALPVTTEVLQAKARELSRERGVSAADFKASRGWLQKFMKRFGFSLRRRTSIAQKLPADYEEKLLEFQRFVLRKREARAYPLGQIGNADQTPVYFDMPVAYTVSEKGAKEVKVRSAGYEKQRATVMLCCTADGHKLPPYIVFKRKTLPAKEAFPRKVIVRANENGWMTSAMVEEWLNVVWRRRPGALLCKHSLLVLDSYRGHLTDSVKAALAEMNTDLAVIPGGMTGQLQPLDVCINKPFKDRLRGLYTDWLSEEDHQLTPTGRIKRASLSQLAGWVAAAWDDIPETLIVRSFKKCSISNALDGTEDCAVFEDSDKEASDEGSSDDDSE
uniref:Pogo ele1 orf1-h 1e-40-j 4 n=1 Tax=Rhipicephalus zambeziensis TaxID=60191 RepID=A0A224YXZ2_9ACAR